MTSREASAVAPKTKATPAVNPKTNKAGPGGRCCQSGAPNCKGSRGLIPKLSLDFYATGRDCGQVLIHSLYCYQYCPRHYFLRSGEMSSTRQSKWPLFVGNSNGSAVVITLTLMWVVCSTTPMAMATFGVCHDSAMNTRPNKVPFHRMRTC